ncbi:MAG: hypothetical protein JEZ08_25240 [Clostridiales bacterium]|nr:hypothetical protein [Clostridiales bacterium]
MKFRYSVNLDLYKVCVIISNHARWKGLVDLALVLEKYKEEIDSIQYDFFEYGLLVLQNGQDPDTLKFFLDEEIKRIEFENKDNYLLHKDCRMIRQIISWMQVGDIYSRKLLLSSIYDNSMEAGKLLGNLRQWSYLNQFDLSLTYDEFLELSIEEQRKIENSNALIRTYYEKVYGI